MRLKQSIIAAAIAATPLVFSAKAKGQVYAWDNFQDPTYTNSNDQSGWTSGLGDWTYYGAVSGGAYTEANGGGAERLISDPTPSSGIVWFAMTISTPSIPLSQANGDYSSYAELVPGQDGGTIQPMELGFQSGNSTTGAGWPYGGRAVTVASGQDVTLLTEINLSTGDWSGWGAVGPASGIDPTSPALYSGNSGAFVGLSLNEIYLSASIGMSVDYLALAGTAAQALDAAPVVGPPQWKVDATGDWNIPSNWIGGAVPTGIDAEADLFGAITQNRTIGIDNTPVTLGTLNFNNANTYTIAGSSTLTMQSSTNNANIIVQQGTGAISVATILASNTTLNVAPSATLNFSGPLTIDSGVSVSQTGGGTVNYNGIVTLLSNADLALGNTTANTLNISNHALASITGTGSILNVYNLNIIPGGSLDVGKNQVNINYNTTPFTGSADPVNTVREELLAGYGNGTWNGTGITSSAAAADPGHGLGYIDNGSTVTVKYALFGDATLDGTVNFNDLLALAGNYTSTTADWAEGDFNYDGTVNFSDLLLLAGNYTATLSGDPAVSSSFAADWALAEAEVAAVPEPASIGILAIGAIGLMSRRKRALA